MQLYNLKISYAKKKEKIKYITNHYVIIKNLKMLTASHEYIAMELLLLTKVSGNLLVLVLCRSRNLCLLKL